MFVCRVLRATAAIGSTEILSERSSFALLVVFIVFTVCTLTRLEGGGTTDSGTSREVADSSSSSVVDGAGDGAG